MVQKPESDIEPKERRIDLSLPQVAGSAMAAVAAAVAAAQLGVYGTILGAGVMSVVATCGGSVFQHFFRRTGEQIREVTVQVKHPGREVTVLTRGTRGTHEWTADGGAGGARGTGATPGADDSTSALRPADATTVLRAVDPTALRRETDATTVLRQVPADADRTQMLKRVDEPRPLAAAPHGGEDEEFSGATTHGTRLRGWKRSALGAAAVFVVSMAGITTYELASGNDLSGGRGTTVGSVVRGGGHGSGSSDPEPSVGTDPGGTRSPGQDDEGTPGTGAPDGATPSPGAGQDGRSSTEPTPTPTPSGSTGASTAPVPSPTPSRTTPGDGGSASPAPSGADDTPGQEDRSTPGTGAGQ